MKVMIAEALTQLSGAINLSTFDLCAGEGRDKTPVSSLTRLRASEPKDCHAANSRETRDLQPLEMDLSLVVLPAVSKPLCSLS